MIARLEQNDEALRDAQAHSRTYIEAEERNPNKRK
jgi:hypothetical protein